MNTLHFLLVANLLFLQVDTSSSFSPVSLLPTVATNPNILFLPTRRLPPSSSSPSSPSWHNHHSTIMASSSSNNENQDPINMSDLQKRFARQQTQYAELLMEQSKYSDDNYDDEGGGGEPQRTIPESVHIILFHPGTEKQHVHTIEFPQGSGNNLILAFESGGDCVEFARMLQDLEFAGPSPEETMFEPFAQYCEMSDLSLMIVPKGFDLTPPQMNADDDDYDDDDDGNVEEDDDIRPIVEDNLAAKNDDEDVLFDDLDAWG